MSILDGGKFVVGCNYWASHAGTAMWSDWRPDVVDDDLGRLAQGGIEVLRVFPLWCDFQPLHLLRGYQSQPIEYRHGETLLPDDPAGQAGLSALALERFAQFTQMAQKHHLGLIVGLITGWMSGRLFIPHALEGKNLLSDPMAIKWQVRFIKHFVAHFADCTAIVAWNPGNECNCMAQVDEHQSWLWSTTIVDAIRCVDSTRPILAGMHSLSPAPNRPWRIQDQGELFDGLTTHPYPVFIPNGDLDPLNTLRTGLQATAESRMYADISGKPCLIEELGTLGLSFADEDTAADFIRMNLFSAWAHDCHGLFWWCAHDQDHLTRAPYEWSAVERELGLMRPDKTTRPVFGELTKFRRFIEQLPFASLPSRLIDAVCILSDAQDHWPVACSSFVLAKQAGLDIEFQYQDQPLRDCAIYLLPCITGFRVMAHHRWLELLERIHVGATLYISQDSGMFTQFEPITGLRVKTRRHRCEPAAVSFDGFDADVDCSYKVALEKTRADVLAAESDGNPAFTCCQYGRGKVFFLTLPIEIALAAKPGAFHLPDAKPLWRLYQTVAGSITSPRIVAKSAASVGLTEHILDQSNRIIVAINYSSQPVAPGIAMEAPWRIDQLLHGDPAHLQKNSAAVFTITDH